MKIALSNSITATLEATLNAALIFFNFALITKFYKQKCSHQAEVVITSTRTTSLYPTKSGRHRPKK